MVVEHTPPPWRVVEDGTDSGRWLTVLGRDDYFDDGSPQEICRTSTVRVRNRATPGWVDAEDADEIRANARLLKAAPSLLEAAETAAAKLEALMRSVGWTGETGDAPASEWAGPWVGDAHRALRAAIDEAREVRDGR